MATSSSATSGLPPRRKKVGWGNSVRDKEEFSRCGVRWSVWRGVRATSGLSSERSTNSSVSVFLYVRPRQSLWQRGPSPTVAFQTTTRRRHGVHVLRSSGPSDFVQVSEPASRTQAQAGSCLNHAPGVGVTYVVGALSTPRSLFMIMTISQAKDASFGAEPDDCSMLRLLAIVLALFSNSLKRLRATNGFNQVEYPKPRDLTPTDTWQKYDFCSAWQVIDVRFLTEAELTRQDCTAHRDSH